MGEEREFTVEEANALIPSVSRSLRAIQGARQTVLAGAQHLKRTATLDGGGRQGTEYWEALQELRRQIESLTGQGIVLRDPEMGLIDFPARREGQPVFLCWRLGEDRVEFWHSPQTGFGGRQPL